MKKSLEDYLLNKHLTVLDIGAKGKEGDEIFFRSAKKYNQLGFNYISADLEELDKNHNFLKLCDCKKDDCPYKGNYIPYIRLDLKNIETINNIEGKFDIIYISNVLHYPLVEISKTENSLMNDEKVIEFINKLSKKLNPNGFIILRGENKINDIFKLNDIIKNKYNYIIDDNLCICRKGEIDQYYYELHPIK